MNAIEAIDVKRQNNYSKLSNKGKNKSRRKLARIYEREGKKLLAQGNSEIPAVRKASENFHKAGMERLQAGDLAQAIKDYKIARDYSPPSLLKEIEKDLEMLEKRKIKRLKVINKTTATFMALSFILSIFFTLERITGFAISYGGELSNFYGLIFFLIGFILGIFLLIKNYK